MKNDTNIINASEKAAKWWSKNIGTGTRSNILDEIRRAPTDSERAIFYSTLFDSIIQSFMRTDVICLTSNYCPEGILEDVAEECDMKDIIFPNNIIMCVSDTNVVVYNSATKSKKVLYGHSVDLEKDFCV